MPRYFLGVDGGQSSTTAIIGDETGRIAGIGRGGPCNHVGASEGRAKFVDVIQSSLREACAPHALALDSAAAQPTRNRFSAKSCRANILGSQTMPSSRWPAPPPVNP